MAAQDVFNDGRFVSSSFVGFELSTAELPEVVQYDVDGDIEGWLTRCQRGLVTHDATPRREYLSAADRQRVPIQNVPSITPTTANAIGGYC